MAPGPNPHFENAKSLRAHLSLCEHKRAAIARPLATVQSSESGWAALQAAKG